MKLNTKLINDIQKPVKVSVRGMGWCEIAIKFRKEEILKTLQERVENGTAEERRISENHI